MADVIEEFRKYKTDTWVFVNLVFTASYWLQLLQFSDILGS